MSGRRVALAIAIAAAVILLGGKITASLITEYQWYASIDAEDVWRVQLFSTIAVAAGSFAVATLYAFAHVYAVRRSVVSLVLPRSIGNIEIPEEIPGRYLVGAAFLIAACIGLVFILPSDTWPAALLAKRGLPFNERDPQFSADLGFFVYWLPFEEMLYEWAILLVAAVTLVVIVLYALTPSLRWERGALYVSAYVRRHFTIIGAVVLLLLAWSYRLAMFRLLSFGGGTGGIFNEFDKTVQVPANLILAVIALCAAIIVAWAGWTGQMRLAFIAVSIVIGLSLASRTIGPLMMRRSVPAAERRSDEASYVGTRLAYTRVAYAVDSIRSEPLGAGFDDATLLASQVSLWNDDMLSLAVERTRRLQAPQNRIAWIARPHAIAASLIEHATDGRDEWSIEQFEPSRADEHGLPMRANAPSADVPAIDPAVYDSAPAYTVLPDSNRLLAGVEMTSTRSRLLHAWSLQNFRLLFGELPANRPVMMQRRDVRERIAALVPFFEMGEEARPVVAGDSLYWVLELYSASSTYPLAQRFTILGAERSYFRHAATAVVNAASGKLHIVLVNSPDRIALTWAAIFPQLFRPESVLAREVRAALPPVAEGAYAQALAFSVAGFRGDTLETRHFPVADESGKMPEPLRAVVSSCGGLCEIRPLLDSTERVRGVVVATGGALRHTAWFPLVGADQRWNVVLDRMRMADTSSHDPFLVHTPMQVVPLNGQPVYIQSSFTTKPGGPPSLRGVTILRNGSVSVAPTLAAALGSSGNEPTVPALSPAGQVRTDSLYRAMREALSRGDWTAFGRAFDALGLALHAR